MQLIGDVGKVEWALKKCFIKSALHSNSFVVNIKAGSVCIINAKFILSGLT